MWAVAIVILLAYAVQAFLSARYCGTMGTDFRGYYAAAQIAWQRGFSEVYDQHLQEEYQATLPHRCPDSSYAPPLLSVYMPYLPVFILVVLPLVHVDFTSAYYVWVLLNLAGLLLYLLHFARAIGERGHLLRILMWMLCAALISNLFLGQMNVLLVICIGEAVLALTLGRSYLGGFWLAGLLMKPHTLILLLPGLAISRSWKALLGFAGGAASIVGISLLLGGVRGVWSSVQMAFSFAGTLIQTASTMMNFRGLALNLARVIPPWFAWGVAVASMAFVAVLVFYLWRFRLSESGLPLVLLFLATFSATSAVTWHSHFYLLLLLIPLLLYLDLKGQIPKGAVWVWVAFPPAMYFILYLASPEHSRNMFGLAMLVLNLSLFTWTAGKLLARKDIQR